MEINYFSWKECIKFTEIFKIIKETFKEGENLKLEKKNGRIILSMSKDTNKAPKWFSDWSNDILMPRLDKTDARLDKIESRLERIENCPTIKKELAEQSK